MISSLKNRGKIISVFIKPSVTLLKPVEKVIDGVLVRSSSYQTVDFSAVENQMLARDFSIGNLLAVGAYNTLKQSIVINTSRIKASDSFDNFNVAQNVQDTQTSSKA